jgi:hypothetical protein
VSAVIRDVSASALRMRRSNVHSKLEHAWNRTRDNVVKADLEYVMGKCAHSLRDFHVARTVMY